MLLRGRAEWRAILGDAWRKIEEGWADGGPAAISTTTEATDSPRPVLGNQWRPPFAERAQEAARQRPRRHGLGGDPQPNQNMYHRPKVRRGLFFRWGEKGWNNGYQENVQKRKLRHPSFNKENGGRTKESGSLRYLYNLTKVPRRCRFLGESRVVSRDSDARGKRPARSDTIHFATYRGGCGRGLRLLVFPVASLQRMSGTRR